MIEFDENKMINLEYEITIATQQFENFKPKIKMKCDFKDAEKGMDFCRKLLQKEYFKVKAPKQAPKQSDENQSQKFIIFEKHKKEVKELFNKIKNPSAELKLWIKDIDKYNNAQVCGGIIKMKKIIEEENKNDKT